MWNIMEDLQNKYKLRTKIKAKRDMLIILKNFKL